MIHQQHGVAVTDQIVHHTCQPYDIGRMQADAGLIVRDKAFAESGTAIPWSLANGDWPLLTAELDTPVQNHAKRPSTLLQKRWLKALLQDPRIKLFQVDDTGLEDV